MKYTIEIDHKGEGKLLNFQEERVKKFVKSFFEMNKIDPLGMNNNQVQCPKCDSDKYVKNGISSGRQRYKCSRCGKTFSAVTYTSVHHIHKVEKWSNFVFLMLSSKVPPSLTEISEKLGITRMTAHTWKHKLLSSMIGQAKIKLDDVIEADEVFEKFSLKGQCKESRSKIENRFHGKKKNASFLCVHNRKGDFDFYPLRVQNPGQIHWKYIGEAVRHFKIKSGTTVITDKSKGAKKYFKTRKGINHLTFKSKKGETSVLHNNNINSMRKHFKEWKSHFHGYSTKYIWNYLKWYRFHRMFVRHVSNEIMQNKEIERMVKNSVNDDKGYLRHRSIPEYYEQFLKRA